MCAPDLPDLPDLDVNSQAMAEQLEEEETMAPEPEKEEEAATSIISKMFKATFGESDDSARATIGKNPQ